MKILPLFLLPIFCFSCNGLNCPDKNSHQDLVATAKQWFPYTGNQQIVIENNNKQRDTLSLVDYFSGDEDVFNGPGCPATKAEVLRGKIVDNSTKDIIRVEVYESEIILMEITKKNLWTLYYENKKHIKAPTSYRRFERELTLNSKTFKDVLAVECSSLENNCKLPGITKFYFAKNQGLIAIEKNATLWTAL